MATKIFLNNVWQDYDYEYLYNNLGVTRTKSKNIVAYDSSMNEISGWYNSGYNWIIRDNQWYSVDSTPYYVRQNSSVSLYRIDKKTSFPVYKKNDEEFILNNGSFTTSQSLLDDYGYTQTPSTVWDIDNAIPWSWYNSDLNEYWDDREGYKNWSPDPPDVSCPIPEEDMIFTGTDTLIMPDDDIIFCVNLDVPTKSFYFTSRGREEDEDTEITTDSRHFLYNEDGSVADEDYYDGASVLNWTTERGDMFTPDSSDVLGTYSTGSDDLLDVYRAGETIDAWSIQVKKTNPPQPLPESLPDVQIIVCWLSTNQGSTGSSPPTFTTLVYDADNNRIPYSSNSVYSVCAVTSYPDAEGDFYVVKSTNDNIAIHRANGTQYLNIYWVAYGQCNDTSALVVPVYNSSKKEYKAFRFTIEGIDYYYVLDRVHNNWVSDLSIIGYTPYLEFDVGLRWTGSDWRSINLSTDDWFYSGVLKQSDVDLLNSIGIGVQSITNAGTLGNINFNPYYSYKIVALYSDIIDGKGSGEILFDSTKFWCENCSMYLPTYTYPNAVVVQYAGASGYARGCRIRIQKIAPTPIARTAYLNSTKSQEMTFSSLYTLYDENGNIIYYDSNFVYTLVAYYSSSDSAQLAPKEKACIRYAGSKPYTLDYGTYGTSGAYYIQRALYIATPKQP